MFNRVWDGIEKSDRRAHNHRCVRCSSVLKDGEYAVFVRVRHGTKAVHVECADVIDIDGMTYRQRFHAWSAA